MSQFELEDQTLRVSYKKSWEKIIESLELDTLDSNEIPDKMFESDATTACGSICRRDSLHRFLDETERRCCKERECSDKVIKEMRAEAESLREQIFGLEKALNEETEKSKSYFKVIESLEKDNEKWEEDYGELKEKYKLLNERLCRAEKQIEVNRQESIMKMLGRGRKDSGSSGKFEDKLTAKIGLVRTKTRSVLPEDIRKRKSEGANVDEDNDGDNMVEKTTECELVRDFFKGKKTHADELWMNKFKLLKEKLLSEQKKTRNLEFLINTQKEQLETVEKNLSHLKAEKRFVENKLDKMKEEVNLMNEARLREKCKIDNVIAFCDLFQNCVFPQEELIEKLEKVPSVISSFLKGSSSTISFENKENVYPSQLINSVKKHAILKHFNTSSDGTEDQCAKKTAKELQGIRSTLNNIAETLVQATPSADPSVLKNLDNISHIHLTLEECSKTDSHHILNPHLSCNGKKGNNIFKMAIRNTHDTLWNVQSGRKSSTEQSSEGDGSSILSETL